MSREEVEEMRRSLLRTGERIRAGDLELARSIVEAINDRPLAEQPELTPRERHERLMARVNDEG